MGDSSVSCVRDWRDRLGAGVDVTNVVAFDLETYLISPALVAPPCVVGSFAAHGQGAVIPGLRVGPWLRDVLEQGDHIVGQNIAYDMFIVVQEWPELRDLVIKAYDEGRIHDVKLREQLLDIRNGTYKFEEVEDDLGEVARRPIGYSLADIAKRRVGMDLNKGKDSWRLRYNELHGVPLDQWPKEAKEYATDDASATLRVYESQSRKPDDEEYLAKVEADQVRAAFALHALGSRGLRVDLEAVETLEARLRGARDALYPELVTAGIYRAAGTRDMKRLGALVQEAYEQSGAAAPVTKTGQVQTSRSVLVDSGDPLLLRVAEFNKIEKMLTSFVPALRVGANFPLTCTYNPLVETGRTSCLGIRYGKQKGPQFQNLPRSVGPRECFVPRPGYYFCSVDYSQLELCTLAQIVYDQGCGSNLRDAINQGLDLHMQFAAQMQGWDYKDVVKLKKQQPYKDARQGAKAANFGFPGGLGAKRFVGYAKDNYGVVVTESQARSYQQLWRNAWPDAWRYQQETSAAIDANGGVIGVVIDRTGFTRGKCRYSEACNSPFQSLAASGAKRALWALMKKASDWDMWPVAFCHDEVIAEVPIESAHEIALQQSRVMVEEMEKLVPDVKITAEPALMGRWQKEAETVYEQGRLVPWSPKQAA